MEEREQAFVLVELECCSLLWCVLVITRPDTGVDAIFVELQHVEPFFLVDFA